MQIVMKNRAYLDAISCNKISTPYIKTYDVVFDLSEDDIVEICKSENQRVTKYLELVRDSLTKNHGCNSKLAEWHFSLLSVWMDEMISDGRTLEVNIVPDEFNICGGW